jgi:hypothetical protein
VIINQPGHSSDLRVIHRMQAINADGLDIHDPLRTAPPVNFKGMVRYGMVWYGMVWYGVVVR